MGLDIYLYRYENREDTDRREKEYELASEKNWSAAGEYDTLSEDQKTQVRELNKKAALSLGLTEDGADPATEQIRFDSDIDKEHYFKVGYFRSSYNNGGINSVLRNLGVADLYSIFEPNDQYVFQPDWAAALKKVEEVIVALQEKGNYRCFHVSPNVFGSSKELPSTEKQALDIFLEQLKSKDGFDCYSNRDGYFSTKEPMQVFAIIPGTYNLLKEMPCAYIILKGENEWYLTALQIVKQTIEYVLSKEDKEKYFLHWSG